MDESFVIQQTISTVVVQLFISSRGPLVSGIDPPESKPQTLKRSHEVIQSRPETGRTFMFYHDHICLSSRNITGAGYFGVLTS